MPRRKEVLQAAAVMGRAGAAARMTKITPQRRKEIATIAARARWSRRERPMPGGGRNS